MISLLLTLFFSSVLSLLLLIYLSGIRRKVGAPLPPGPPADPFIGHVRLIPADNPEFTYVKWGKEYDSDILYLEFLGQPVIILNSAEASNELLEKRGAKHSDRPKFYFFEELGWTDSVAFFSSGPRFRKHRKMFQNAFTAANCALYRESQLQQSRKVVERIIANPHDWKMHLITFSTAIILNIGYGITVQEKDDPYVALADRVSEIMNHAGPPGGTLLDIFPPFRYLPKWLSFLVPSLKYARDFKDQIVKVNELPFQAVKGEMSIGRAKPSFTRKMLEARSKIEESIGQDLITDTDISGAAGTIYMAGQDTTYATLIVFVLAMTLNPKIQRKAREEIDSVIGTDRLPNFSDRSRLPYVECVVQETMRWNPVLPLNIPHKSSEDDTYKGYFIPKGSLIIANPFAINRDESIYELPEAFNPDRFIPKEDGGAGEPLPVGNFGFGRRICPGQHLAIASVWIVIATLLATIEFSKTKDEDGNEITPTVRMTTGLVCHPAPFPCTLRPRADNITELLARE